MMHRSNTTIGSLFSELDSKSKKSNIWRSFMGSKDSKKASLQGFNKSASSSDISLSTISVSREKAPVQLNEVIPRPVTKSSKRQSFFLPNESRSREKKIDSSVSRAKHMSSCTFADLRLDDVQTTDPKELEFYSSLFGAKESVTEEDEDSSKTESHTRESSLSYLTEEEEIKFLSTNNEQEQSLSSALETYKLFTNKRQSFFSPTDSSFSYDLIESKDTSSERQGSLPSVPSFVSAKTIESSMSVLSVSNSLWVGSNIVDVEDTFEKEVDYLHTYGSDFDADDIFDESDSPFLMEYKRTHRTSLIFV